MASVEVYMPAIIVVAYLSFIILFLVKFIRDTEPAIIPGMVYVCKYKKDLEFLVLEISPFGDVWYTENNKRGKSYSLKKERFIKFFTIKEINDGTKRND